MTNGSARSSALRKQRQEEREAEAKNGAGTGAAVESALRPVWSAYGAGSDKFERILDAAVDVIAENGFFNSPVSKIAARAGVADGTVYLYFKSKDDVLKAAIDAQFERFYARVEEEFATLPGARERLEFIGRLHLEAHVVNRSMAILMQTEMRQSAKFITAFSYTHLAKYIQIVRDVIRLGQKQGVFRKELSAGVVAHCWFGAVDELLSTAVFTGREYPPTVTVAQVIDILLHGIGAKAARARS